MNDTDKVLAEVLQKALTAAEKTGQFVIDQAPDLVRQLLIWQAVKNGAALFVCLVLLYTAYRIFVWTDKEVKRREGEWNEYFLSIMSIAGCTIFGAPFFFDSLFTLLKIFFAPKIYLIEYAAELIK